MRRASRFLVPLTVAVAVVGCGQEDQGPPVNEGAMHQAFEDASLQSGVPMDLLMAIGWHATHWVQVIPQTYPAPDPGSTDPNADPGESAANGSEAPPSYGVMQLSSSPDNDTLDLAAQLEGVDASKLESDAAANILGAALVLRRYADEMYGDTDIEGMDLFAWRDVVARWTGLTDDPSAAYDITDEIYEVLRDGAGLTLADGEILELEPNPGLGSPDDGTGSDGTDTSAGLYGQHASDLDYSGAHWVPASSHNYTVGRPGYTLQYLVIHDMEGSYSASISWFENSASQVSAHYMERSHDGDVTQMVAESNTAWHTGYWPYNVGSVGIEHEGFMNDASWYTDAMYRSSARLACSIIKRHPAIKVDRQHIIGHSEVPGCSTPGGGGSGCHRDPGPHWNWTYYMSLIRDCVGGTSSGGGGSTGGGGTSGGGTSGGGGSSGGSVGPGNGTLEGLVYHDGNTSARVAGAKIKLSNGKTATADSNGYWKITTTAGHYTVTASASGYHDGSVSRELAAGTDVWASTNLSKSAAATTGKLSGVVYVAGNTTHRVSGATINVGGHRATTDANGRYSLEVGTGGQTLSVSASGYQNHSQSVTIHAGQTTQADVALSPTSSRPATVSGYIYDLATTSKRLVGASVTLKSGSTTHSTTADENGEFQFTNVAAGSWTLSASASGYGAGSKAVSAGSGAHVTANLGLRLSNPNNLAHGTLIGVVYESPNSSKRIAGATVVLSNGERATTGSDGVYQLPANGSVTAVASASGYLSRSVTRTVPAGQTIWGSIALTRGTENTGSSVVAQCKPTGTPHTPPAADDSAKPVSPLHGEVEPATPTLTFTGIHDPTASYIVRVYSSKKGAAPIEWKVGPQPFGTTASTKPPKAFAADGYAWTVVALWPDCKTDEPDGWGFFVVQ